MSNSTARAQPRVIPYAPYAVYLVLLLGFALRAAFVVQGQDLPVKYDELAYVQRGHTLLANPLAYDDLVRPPVYPAFLALSFRLFGDSRFVTGIVQALVSTLLIAVLYTLARRLVGRRDAALVAALFAALYLELITLSRIFLSETLFAFLSALGITLVVRAWRGRGERDGGRAERSGEERYGERGERYGERRERYGERSLQWVAAGVALALAGLTREIMGYFALVVLPLWMILADIPNGKRAVGSVLAVGLGLGLVFVPWVARNWALEGRFVLSNTRGEQDLLRDNWRVEIQADPAARRLGKAGEQARLLIRQHPPQERTRAILAKIVDVLRRYPLEWLRDKFTRLELFWRPFGIEARVLRFETLGAPLRDVVRGGLGYSAVLVLLLGAAGFFIARDDAPKLLILLYILYSLVVFVLTHYFGRFRLPLLVFVMPYAALTVVQGASWLRAPSLRPFAEHLARTLAAGVVLVLFGILSFG